MDAVPSPLPRAPRLSPGSLLLATLRVWVRNAVPFTAVSLLLELPLAALELRAGPEADPRTGPLMALFAWLLGLVASAALSLGVLQALAGGRPRVGEMLSTTSRRLWPIFAAAGLYALSVLVGLFLLIVPGVLAMLAGYLAIPVVVAEPLLGPEAALRRSWSLTQGHRMALLWVLVLVVGLELLLALGLDAALRPLNISPVLRVAVVTAADAVLSGLSGCCPAVAYHQLGAVPAARALALSR